MSYGVLLQKQLLAKAKLGLEGMDTSIPLKLCVHMCV